MPPGKGVSCIGTATSSESRAAMTETKARARIEQAVGKLKRFKRIALRCEKTAQNYARSSRLLSALS
jgi:hypothetical protein